MSRTSPIATMRSIGKTFENGLVALDDISLDLHDGERLGLLGASGCGKSTVLRILAGLDQPTSGDVDIPAHGRESLSYVFQSPTLLPWKTVFNNVLMPLQLRGDNNEAAHRDVEAILERVELSEFHDAYPNQLSGGMQMRVSIARALVTKPTLLLMDEPFAALDEITRFRLNDLLLEQQARESCALLFVTHSVFESVYLCDRVAVMSPRPGRVVEIVDTSTDMERNSDYRTSKAYVDACARVSAALHSAMR
ncbi:MAG: ABC transporter ATP-binding protein [Pseudomonadota bacterium]